MGLINKIKDILFEEEEYTEAVKIPVEKKEEVAVPKVEEKKEEVKEEVEPEVKSERETFSKENTFNFPDFDEEEFTNSISKPKPNPNPAPQTRTTSNQNVLEYERKKTTTQRTDYGRYERIETREYTEKKKFKPSPIISPVYGVLNKDYKADDIVDKKNNSSNISIDEIRKKAFEPEVEVLDDTKELEPVVTFFEEKSTETVKVKEDNDNYKTIDDLLEDASDEISLDDTMEIPVTNHLDAIEEELEKLDTEAKSNKNKDLDDTLDNDLFELIDSMYDEREEGNE